MAIKEKMPPEQGEQALPENGQAAAPADAPAAADSPEKAEAAPAKKKKRRPVPPQKVKKALDPLVTKAKQKPQTAVLGQFLYDVGFWAEYTVLRAGRHLRRFGELLRARACAVGRFFKNTAGKRLLNAWKEVSAPFVRLWNGSKNIAALVRQEKKNVGTAKAVGEGLAYFGRGVRRYAPLIRPSFAYVLPLLALGLFVCVVNTVLSYNYVLAVEINGKVVGHVQSEQVFDAATAELTQRIDALGDESREFTITPTYSLDVSDTLMDEAQMANVLLQESSDEIQEATAIYVNGSLLAVTTEGEALHAFIDGLKAPYEDPDNPNLRVEFTKDVELQDGNLYFTDSLTDLQGIIDILTGEEQGEVTYTVQKGDVPSSVASKFGLSVSQLQAENPQQDILEDFFVGDVLTISQAMPYLEVKRIVTRTVQESIDYDTITQDSADLPFDTYKIEQEGEEGLDEVVYEDTYYGDSNTPETVEISRTTLKEPVTRVRLRGTKLANGMVVSGTNGTWVWPVPSYKGISRWMSSSHKGVDIRANYGASIIASDGGVVTTAGWHYSYGNYIIINHGGGRQTLYAHCSSLAVHAGQAVSQGQVIGYVGSTGNSTGNHCHFEMFENGVRISAYKYFAGM